MSEFAAELHHVVASEHDLPEGSADFLTGDTLEQVEASATAFKSRLQERQGEQKPVPGLFAAAATDKAERQRALVSLFTGGQAATPQPRDEHGRFAAPGGGFDGGARPSVPPEPESHESWLVRVLGSREADSGGLAF
jgi:hypothetical protein